MQNVGTEPDVSTGEFERLYQRLEETVRRLDDGGLGLDESIQLYESGMRLAQRCRQMLDTAELRISELEREFADDGDDDPLDDGMT